MRLLCPPNCVVWPEEEGELGNFGDSRGRRQVFGALAGLLVKENIRDLKMVVQKGRVF